MDCCSFEAASGACFDSSGAYRYALWRRWDPAAPAILFIMLNPSTAGASTDDPTVRRCLAFARRWGFGALFVANLFARCAASPRLLRAGAAADLASAAADLTGAANDTHLAALARHSQLVVAAWGANRLSDVRAPEVSRLAGPTTPLACLGLTKSGHPRHPLYVRAATQPLPFDAPARR